jgi:hypothetical protein
MASGGGKVERNPDRRPTRVPRLGVVLISGVGHNGWLNTRALELLAVPERTGPLDENDWFPVSPGWRAARGGDRGGPPAGPSPPPPPRGSSASWTWSSVWLARLARAVRRGVDQLRSRTTTYPDRLEGGRSGGAGARARSCPDAAACSPSSARVTFRGADARGGAGGGARIAAVVVDS